MFAICFWISYSLKQLSFKQVAGYEKNSICFSVSDSDESAGSVWQDRCGRGKRAGTKDTVNRKE
ncbi:hypothetical protein DWX43_16340 [Clostridium sp. AF19-22AC]|nr:hypothetical protein DWX43_16340 [Clostridium sp. AF19-22AC]